MQRANALRADRDDLLKKNRGLFYVLVAILWKVMDENNELMSKSVIVWSHFLLVIR